MRNGHYVGDAKAGVAGIVQQRGDPSSSLSGILDESNGIAPHVVGQVVQVFTESKSIFCVRLEMARHDRVKEALGDVLIDQAVHLGKMPLESTEDGGAGGKVYCDGNEERSDALDGRALTWDYSVFHNIKRITLPL